MDFDCDFNAPMFVDFQNLDEGLQEREQAEAYFEVHHEFDQQQSLNGSCVNAENENIQRKTLNLGKESNALGTNGQQMPENGVNGEMTTNNTNEIPINDVNPQVSTKISLL